LQNQRALIISYRSYPFKFDPAGTLSVPFQLLRLASRMPKRRLEDCVHAILPPSLSERVCGYYGHNYLTKKVMAPFWHKFNHDGAFQDRIWRKAKELFDTIFDEDTHSWGNWPTDPEECAGIGFILGKLLQNDVNELIFTANEIELEQLDALVKTEGISLLDCVINQLIDRKSEGGDETNMSRPVSLFIWPCPQSF
jgi:hypothetical protein